MEVILLVAQFFYNHADHKQVGKNRKSGGSYVYLTPKTYSGEPDVNIFFKDDTDLINPVFTFKGNKIIKNNINYIHVNELDRWYYVNDITYSQQNVELHCKVDVLTSFASEIKDQYAIVLRQEQNYNLYITDDKMRTEAQGRILTYPFTNGFETSISGGSVKSASYILMLNGGGESGS